MTRSIFVFLLAVCLAASSHAYGPNGHKIIGAIADERLAGTPAGAKVRALLDGFRLEKAAVIPDEIRGWDERGVDDPAIFRYRSRPRIDAQLADFWRANSGRTAEMPSHQWFHYTDVPLIGASRYADGKIGRREWDIVQMIRYCVEVLQGARPEDNPRKITKPIAVVLLAHYVGDIHQPLHVGAHYFDHAGQLVDPEKTQPAYDHRGGNNIIFRFSPAASARLGQRKAKFHGYWDNQVVALNLPPVAKELAKEERRRRADEARRELVRELVEREPQDWKLSKNIPLQDYGEAWADEILPLAREAHDRLAFHNVRHETGEDGVIHAVGVAEEKEPYHEWAAGIAREQMHKAGWRLADLLQRALN